MSNTLERSALQTTGTAPPRRRNWLGGLALRLHFYAGILVGPFLLIAALSGALYAFTPQLEEVVYHDELTASQTVGSVPLEEQVGAARAYLDNDEMPVAVRPAVEGGTTRVMFDEPSLGASETRAIFVDPGTAEVKGDLTAYGTSGALPVRTWIDQLHRSLHLGDAGRLYSELAASWLWVIALGGVVLWIQRWRTKRRARGSLYPDTKLTGRNKTLSWHASAGIWLALGFLFLSATGLTWSVNAGANVAQLRSMIGWSTPTIATDLETGSGTSGGAAHEGHHGGEAAGGGASDGGQAVDPASFDSALNSARSSGIDAEKIEIAPPAEHGSAWTVTEIDRSWPTQVDSVALNPASMAVVDKVSFDDYSLAAKLARWGIDAHMGVLFGLPNQLLLAATALGLAAMIIWGYRMWWKRRPTKAGATQRMGMAPRGGQLRKTPPWALAALAVVTVAVGLFLPLLGISLAAFLIIDTIVGAVHKRRAGPRRTV